MKEYNYFKTLLAELGVLELYRILKCHGITYESLPYLSEHDINDTLKHIPVRMRAIFRERLFMWRNREVNEMMQTYQKRCLSMIPCFRCGKSFLNVDNFIKHLDSAHAINSYTSEIVCKMNNCNKKFEDCKELKSHILDDHVL